MKLGSQLALDDLDAGKYRTTTAFRKRLQELLTDDGYYTGSVDGSFGPQTKDALAVGVQRRRLVT